MKPTAVHILTKEKFVSADKTYDVECKSSGSRPAPATVTWWRGNKQIKRLVKNVSLCSIMALFRVGWMIRWWVPGMCICSLYTRLKCAVLLYIFLLFIYPDDSHGIAPYVQYIIVSGGVCMRNTIEIMVLWLFGSLFEGQTFFVFFSYIYFLYATFRRHQIINDHFILLHRLYIPCSLSMEPWQGILCRS